MRIWVTSLDVINVKPRDGKFWIGTGFKFAL